MHNPGFLETLTDDQRAQLLTWMEVFPMRVVLEKVAAPSPEGFGLKTHITTLRRFYEGAHLSEIRHQLSVLAPAVTPAEAESGYEQVRFARKASVKDTAWAVG